MMDNRGCVMAENEEVYVLVVIKENYSISDQEAVDKAIDLLQTLGGTQ